MKNILRPALFFNILLILICFVNINLVFSKSLETNQLFLSDTVTLYANEGFSFDSLKKTNDSNSSSIFYYTESLISIDSSYYIRFDGIRGNLCVIGCCYNNKCPCDWNQHLDLFDTSYLRWISYCPVLPCTTISYASNYCARDIRFCVDYLDLYSCSPYSIEKFFSFETSILKGYLLIIEANYYHNTSIPNYNYIKFVYNIISNTIIDKNFNMLIKNNSIIVYPNPANDKCNIYFKNIGINNIIYIYDISGKLINNINIDHNGYFIWNIKNIKDGLYLLKYNKNKYIYKLSIIR